MFWPTSIRAASQDTYRDLGSLRCLKNSLSGTETNRASGVVGLLAVGRPSDITRFVVPVVVWKAINRMSRRRSQAYVCEKRLERTAPPLADTYPACAITKPFRMLRIRATVFQVDPRIPFRCVGPPMRCEALSANCRRMFFSQATATMPTRRTQGASSRKGNSATVTQTFPSRFAFIGTDALKDSQPAETLASQLKRWHLDGLYA